MTSIATLSPYTTHTTHHDRAPEIAPLCCMLIADTALRATALTNAVACSLFPALAAAAQKALPASQKTVAIEAPMKKSLETEFLGLTDVDLKSFHFIEFSSRDLCKLIAEISRMMKKYDKENHHDLLAEAAKWTENAAKNSKNTLASGLQVASGVLAITAGASQCISGDQMASLIKPVEKFGISLGNSEQISKSISETIRGTGSLTEASGRARSSYLDSKKIEVTNKSDIAKGRREEAGRNISDDSEEHTALTRLHKELEEARQRIMEKILG